jgi:hypothetical protein
MDELVKMVADKVGLPHDKAQMAVQVVIDQLKKQAPALSSQIDSLVSGGGGLGGLASGLGGLMGGQK